MNHNEYIGVKVKALRTANKYTLKDLSEKSGLSIGFLSQLERGMSNIGVDSLARLAEIFKVDIADFFSPATSSLEKDPVCRGLTLRNTQISPKIVQCIHSNHVKDFEMFPRVLMLMPFSETGKGLGSNRHPGEEFIYVLEGMLTVYVNDQHYDLNPGDSIQIHSTDAHNLNNRTNRITKVLIVTTPNPVIHGTEHIII